MVLSSAAASTQTTILPTARTALSMGVYKAMPDAFGHIHRQYLTPTVATVAMGGDLDRHVRGDELPLRAATSSPTPSPPSASGSPSTTG